jgi:hypothetical protein
MDNQRILQDAVPNEVRRIILREALDRYRNELMDDEERELLWDRIQRLRRALGIVACCAPRVPSNCLMSIMSGLFS